MKRFAFVICAALVAAPAFAQKTNEQATEEGRDKNTQYAKDSALTSKVHTALANDVGLNTLTRINVDSDKGVVTLKGMVDSEDVKKRAESVAKKVGGVTSVKNELRVKGG
ncbi:MAG TPA: BON domain-containing protein [Burkholderiales bacterium]|nr:BON domain-containing protein [Burkholderiales bacterium]